MQSEFAGLLEGMDWADRLAEVLKPYNLSEIARELRWRETRISQMVGRRAIPNAIDAVLLCRYLNVKVEEIFAPEDAEAPIRQKARTPAEARAIALDRAVRRRAAAHTESRPAQNPAKGKEPKSL